MFSVRVAFRRVSLVLSSRVFYHGVRWTVRNEDPAGLADDGLLFLTGHQCGRGKGVRCQGQFEKRCFTGVLGGTWHADIVGVLG